MPQPNLNLYKTKLADGYFKKQYIVFLGAPHLKVVGWYSLLKKYIGFYSILPPTAEDFGEWDASKVIYVHGEPPLKHVVEKSYFHQQKSFR